MERHNARLTRTTLFLFVATLGYMYYTSPDTPKNPQERGSTEAIPELK